jgi:hypothetical protein
VSIVKSSSVFLPTVPGQVYLPVNIVIGFDSKISKASQNTDAQGLLMPVFRFPALLYGSALSTGSGASDQKASDQLDQAQEVSADPKQLLQFWA